LRPDARGEINPQRASGEARAAAMTSAVAGRQMTDAGAACRLPMARRCGRKVLAATWRSGYAADCKSVHPGSIPGVASSPALPPFRTDISPLRRNRFAWQATLVW
jgi:hypothetical protein